ncbi:uncharacterized protein LTR77_004281 [Saxophila tyrrhenica]|uniref:Uncharacterized protein n=1 Tax=Saxophila tyrrhenica TaxID=1690608 RepID=A0AAV9PCC3_9PEZI|nr:hypothetical protein LTR77_004281 [Saxophila tyrrhenica]
MRIPTAATVAVASSLALSGVDAFALDYGLIPRQNAADVASLIIPILEWFGVAFPEAYIAWYVCCLDLSATLLTEAPRDYNADGSMCSISMETEDGGNCKAAVECDDGVKNEYNDWNVCYVGGRQYFTDDRIGPFSITFSQKDGEGEGLTNPILQLEYVNNSLEFDVASLASYYKDKSDCEAGITPLNCADGPFICGYGDMGNSYIYDSRLKRWQCGMPKVGLGGGDETGLDSDAPTTNGYLSGWCTAHVIQYQKEDPAVDSYQLEVKIYDANENEIGSTDGMVSSAEPIALSSVLPWTLVIGTGSIDDHPVTFAYGDQSWDSNNQEHSSNFGAYDSGSRNGDTGFTNDTHEAMELELREPLLPGTAV